MNWLTRCCTKLEAVHLRVFAAVAAVVALAPIASADPVDLSDVEIPISMTSVVTVFGGVLASGVVIVLGWKLGIRAFNLLMKFLSGRSVKAG